VFVVFIAPHKSFIAAQDYHLTCQTVGKANDSKTQIYSNLIVGFDESGRGEWVETLWRRGDYVPITPTPGSSVPRPCEKGKYENAQTLCQPV
jgi:hypothetical protein